MPAARARVRRHAPTGDRVAALDALRVVSMAAVVALHASAAYMTVRIPGLIWLVNEPAGSEFVQQFAWWSYGATMPAFFALAGYAAAAVLDVKGTRGYAMDRARRIGFPFLAAIPVVLIPTVLIWMLGLYLAGRCEVAELLTLSFTDGQIQANRFGPAHLWFLVYLIPMLALLGVVRSWSRERPRSVPGVLSHFCSPLAPLMMAIPTTLILWLGHWWNGVDPILDLRNSFLINPIRDGLNLVAEEGPLVNDRDAVLLLSPEAGVWDQLAGAARPVHPYDISGTADALAAALAATPEQRAIEAAEVRRRAAARTPEDWLADQLSAAD